MTGAVCWMCGRPRGPSPDGLGSHCRRKLATHHTTTPRPAARPGHTQPALEEPPMSTVHLNLYLLTTGADTGPEDHSTLLVRAADPDDAVRVGQDAALQRDANYGFADPADVTVTRVPTDAGRGLVAEF